MQVLATAQAIVRRRGSRLRTVFGPLGVPDLPKATGCATALAAFSDHVILTTGSMRPRVVRIKELNDVIKGRTAVEIVLSRRAAIARAIAAACAGDIVAVLGFGALCLRIVDARGTMLPFDDRAVAASLLEEMRV